MDAVKLKESAEKFYTIDDIYALPDGIRAELVDGQIYYMAPPSRTHQKLSWKLHQKIANYIDDHHGKCEVYAAPFAVFLNEKDDSNYLEPDLSIICDLNKLNEKGCYGAPDWIIEIVSPGNKPMDYFTKLFKYRTAGIREYWIVDPMKQMVIYFTVLCKQKTRIFYILFLDISRITLLLTILNYYRSPCFLLPGYKIKWHIPKEKLPS